MTDRSHEPSDPLVYLRDAIGMAEDGYEQGVLNRAHNQILKYRNGELELKPEICQAPGCSKPAEVTLEDQPGKSVLCDSHAKLAMRLFPHTRPLEEGAERGGDGA